MVIATGMIASAVLLNQRRPPADLAQLVGLYDGEIAWTDLHVGQLLAVIDELGARENTVVVLTADHGEEFFEHDRFGHKIALYQESVRIPLIVRWPQVVPAGKRVTRVAAMVDLAPTLLELAGVEPLPNIYGRSLVPELRGQPTGPVPPAVSELIKERKGHSLLSLRGADWKWIVERNANRVLGLYDLRTDPGELRDLSSRASELRAQAESSAARAMATFGALAEAHPAGSTLSSDPMSPELVRQLRSLGYLGGEDD